MKSLIFKYIFACYLCLRSNIFCSCINIPVCFFGNNRLVNKFVRCYIYARDGSPQPMVERLLMSQPGGYKREIIILILILIASSPTTSRPTHSWNFDVGLT